MDSDSQYPSIVPIGFRYCTVIMTIAKHAERAADTAWAIAIHGLLPSEANAVIQKIEGSAKYGNAVVKGFKEPKEGSMSILTLCLNALAEINYQVIASNGADPGPMVWTLQSRVYSGLTTTYPSKATMITK